MRVVERFFMVGVCGCGCVWEGWSWAQMSATGLSTKFPKTVRKNETWTRKKLIQNLIFEVYLLISDFLAQSLKTYKNWQKDDSFYKTVSLKKNLTYFTNLNLLNMGKMLSQHSQKPTHFTSFLPNMFLVGGKKKKMHCTISRRPRTAFSTWKANICIFLYISERKFLFQRRRDLLLGGEPE